MHVTIPCRVLRFFCFIFLLFFLQGILISAPVHAGNATVKVGKIYSANVGSTVDVIVSVQNPSGMAGFQFELTYNPQVAIVKSVSKGASLPGSAPIVNMANAAAGNIRVAWMDLSPVHNNLDILRISFEVLATGNTPLELKNLELVGLDGSIASQSENGIITTTQDTTPPADPNPDPDPDPDPGPKPLSITTSNSLPHGRADNSYSSTLSASGGTKPYTWELKSGKLPEGLALNKTSGHISGTPAQTGRYDFTIQLKDKDNQSVEKQFTLWVSEAGSAPTDLPTFDYSKYNTTSRVTFKDLTLSQGSMEVNLTPGKMPHTMVVDRNTREIDILVSLYAAEHKLYVNNVLQNAPGASRVALHSGDNNIAVRITSGDTASRLYTISVFRIP